MQTRWTLINDDLIGLMTLYQTDRIYGVELEAKEPNTSLLRDRWEQKGFIAGNRLESSFELIVQTMLHPNAFLGLRRIKDNRRCNVYLRSDTILYMEGNGDARIYELCWLPTLPVAIGGVSLFFKGILEKEVENGKPCLEYIMVENDVDIEEDAAVVQGENYCILGTEEILSRQELFCKWNSFLAYAHSRTVKGGGRDGIYLRRTGEDKVNGEDI